MNLDREKARKAFASYVASYDITNEKIRLKIEHTYKVAALCEQIAISIGFSPEDIDLAWFIGLLHDVGRFEQLRIYNTFIDAESVDHAALAADILFGQGEICRYTQDRSEDELLKTAVSTHSAYRLPENLPKRELSFCNIIRDADKIDILRVNTQSPLAEIYNTTEEELRQAQITEEVMDCVREHHAVLKSLKKTSVDNLAGHIALVFELVYPCSMEIMKDQGCLDQILAFHSENKVTRQQFKEMKNIVYSYEKD